MGAFIALVALFEFFALMVGLIMSHNSTVPSKDTRAYVSAFIASLDAWNTHESYPNLQERAEYIKARGFILWWADKPLLEAIYELERPFNGEITSIERRKLRAQKINNVITLLRAEVRGENVDSTLRWPYTAQNDYTSL